MFLKSLYLLVLVVHLVKAAPEYIHYDIDEDEPERDFEVKESPETFYQNNPDEITANYWNAQAQATIASKVAALGAKPKAAKNVILFIGDGLSHSTVAGARTLLGQRNNKPGEETKLAFEVLPFTGFAKTYCLDKQVAEGACSATALLNGIKSNAGTLGVTGAVKFKDVEAASQPENQVANLAKWFQDKGKRTGFVTNGKVTDATVGALYAVTPNRAWENDLDQALAEEDTSGVEDIASQLINSEVGKNFNVIFGGGEKNFIPIYKKGAFGKRGRRIDRTNLIKQWTKQNQGVCKYVTNKAGLAEITPDHQKVLGLFASNNLPYNLDRNVEQVPSLAEMTAAAIKSLDKGKADRLGYFLVVHADLIDLAHHRSLGQKALDEAIQFDNAVATALAAVSPDTLVVVTADHSNTLVFNGNAHRGNDVLGVAGEGIDKLPYSTLSYSNGPGYKLSLMGRHNIDNDDLSSTDYKYPALVPKVLGTHAADDVGIYAQGPSAELFTSTNEQNVIAHAIAYAGCAGDGLTACQ